MIVKPMLADPIDQTELPRYCEKDEWWFEQKVDGWRKLATVVDGQVRVQNRNGGPTDLPAVVVAELATMTGGPWVLDGELIGKMFWVFDMPEAGKFVQPAQGYEHRRDRLERLFDIWGDGRRHVRLIPTARTQAEKALLAKTVLEHHGEGIMVKHRSGAYVSGRSNRMLKAKYCHDIDAFVTRMHIKGKDNFAVAVYNGKEVVEVGEVTIHAGDGHKVKEGDVVCVKYLHATRDNRLREPTKARLRDDKAQEECTIDQLFYGNKEVLV